MYIDGECGREGCGEEGGGKGGGARVGAPHHRALMDCSENFKCEKR